MPVSPMTRRHRTTLLLFALTLFVNAALLFSIQPMWAKMALPLLGGTPAVWNTCMLFFQGTLLAGYLYAHVSSARLPVRPQRMVQLALLALAALALPISIAPGWAPPAQATPTAWLIGLLVVSIGAPFFALSTGAPLLQRWFSVTGHPSAANPYFLYAASNLGSMAALLAYPFLIEPMLPLARQRVAWMGGYALLVALVAACAWRVRRPVAPAMTYDGEAVARASAWVSDDEPATPAEVNPAPVTWPRRVRWILLSLAPSSLLLGVTTFLTTDVASIPLLWVVPLSLYLLTFVLAFGQRTIVPYRFVLFAQAVSVLSLAVIMAIGAQRRATLLAPIHLAAFFLTALVCHRELARDRPRVTHLTEFYLWISVGGVLGGAFNVLAAPVLFDSILEYPVALVLACALRPWSAGTRSAPRVRAAFDVALPVLLAGALAYTLRTPDHPFLRLGGDARFLYGAFAALALAFMQRPLRFAGGVAALFVGTAIGYGEDETLRFRDRSFFGVYRVLAYPAYHLLQSGTTTHGAQSTEDETRLEPLTYYHRQGPLGQLFSTLLVANPARRVAIVGLGTGTLACYARPGEQWVFYEIDPLVVRIARDPRWFTYLRECQPEARIVLGDARRSLAVEPDSAFDLIVLDAFSSDAIPTHLMTREALAMYLRKLAPGGSIAFHISNRYVDLAPVLTELARDARVPGIVGADVALTAAQRARELSASRWVVVSRKATDHAALLRRPGWLVLPPSAPVRLWTDDFSDVLSVFRWRRPS